MCYGQKQSDTTTFKSIGNIKKEFRRISHMKLMTKNQIRNKYYAIMNLLYDIDNIDNVEMKCSLQGIFYSLISDFTNLLWHITPQIYYIKKYRGYARIYGKLLNKLVFYQKCEDFLFDGEDYERVITKMLEITIITKKQQSSLKKVKFLNNEVKLKQVENIKYYVNWREIGDRLIV